MFHKQIHSIEKDASINDEIDKLRHRPPRHYLNEMMSLLLPVCLVFMDWVHQKIISELVLSLRVGMEIERNQLLRKLVDIQYDRNDLTLFVVLSVFVGMWWKFSLHLETNIVSEWNFLVTRLIEFEKWMH